jgi:hypothetical protein
LSKTPYRFESILNVAVEDQAGVLVQLAIQDKLYLAFYDDMLVDYFTKIIPHDEQHWQQPDELLTESSCRLGSTTGRPAGL